jgi:hypothetical protein
MMAEESMTQGQHAYHKGKKYHSRFEPEIMDDLNAKNR